MFGLGLWELLVVLAIILLLFGAKRLPDLAKTLGKSAQILRKNMQGDGKKAKKEK
jgi:sec-independent protein translocase protein TatA